MRCFYHPDQYAIGTCRHCGRGLCNDCAAIVDDILACKQRHETQVQNEAAALRQASLQAARAASGYVRNAIFYGLVGLLFGVFGLVQMRFLGLQAVFFSAVGMLLLYAGLANFLESRRYR